MNCSKFTIVLLISASAIAVANIDTNRINVIPESEAAQIVGGCSDYDTIVEVNCPHVICQDDCDTLIVISYCPGTKYTFKDGSFKKSNGMFACGNCNTSTPGLLAENCDAG